MTLPETYPPFPVIATGWECFEVIPIFLAIIAFFTLLEYAVPSKR